MTITHHEVQKEKVQNQPSGEETRSIATQRNLCLSCTATKGCTNRRTGYPVHYCDSYKNPQLHDYAPYFPPDANTGEQMSGEALGLCANCVYRPTCTFAISEMGIWHCSMHECMWP